MRKLHDCHGSGKERGDPPRTLFSSEGDWYLPSWSDNGVARR